jgi:hypothetical protein
MLLCLSNWMPMSKDVQLHQAQANIKGPVGASEGVSEGGSYAFTVKGEVQIGQL